jgi:ion channel-forming bestrophin family protein
MIDYENRRWLRILFQLRGSVLPGLLPRILFVAAIGALAAFLLDTRGFKIPAIAHTLVGVALGLLLVFRTNTSYDRYWEGRRLLGTMVNRCRDLARQVVAYLAVDGEAARAERARVVRLTAAFYALVRQHLRGERALEELGEQLTAEERAQLAAVACRPIHAAAWISEALSRAAAAGRLSEQRLQLMDANLTALLDSLGGCERILRTPIPFAYAQHIKTFLFLFLASAPFAMVEAMRWFTPAAAAVLAFALFGIEEIGVEIEDPFGTDPNDLPLDRIGETIARDTRALLAATS